MTQCFEEEHSAIAPRSGTAFSTAPKKDAPEEERWPTTARSFLAIAARRTDVLREVFE